MTTPDPEELYEIIKDMALDGAEYLVMEVSSHALALSKVDPIEFEVGVFTNLTPEHLDLHGSMEEYFKAKSRMFEKCRAAVINYDDKYGRMLADKIKKRAVGEIPADKTLLAALSRATDGCGFRALVGTVASGDLFVSNPAQKQRIRTLFGADACEMEGAAIGQVAFTNGVPFAVLRAISDGGDGMEFSAFATMAAERSTRVTCAFLAEL
jgi:nucleoside phosphorylase